MRRCRLAMIFPIRSRLRLRRSRTLKLPIMRRRVRKRIQSLIVQAVNHAFLMRSSGRSSELKLVRQLVWTKALFSMDSLGMQTMLKRSFLISCLLDKRLRKSCRRTQVLRQMKRLFPNTWSCLKLMMPSWRPELRTSWRTHTDRRTTQRLRQTNALKFTGRAIHQQAIPNTCSACSSQWSAKLLVFWRFLGRPLTIKRLSNKKLLVSMKFSSFAKRTASLAAST